MRADTVGNMAELTVSEKAAKYDKTVERAKVDRKLQKITLMRVTEACSVGGTSALLGVIEEAKPEFETALYGFAQPAVFALVAGGGGFAFTKDGYVREGLGGMFLGGLAKLSHKGGKKLYQLITAP